MICSPVQTLYQFTLTEEVLREFERAVEEGMARLVHHEFKSLEILNLMTAGTNIQ